MRPGGEANCLVGDQCQVLDQLYYSCVGLTSLPSLSTYPWLPPSVTPTVTPSLIIYQLSELTAHQVKVTGRPHDMFWLIETDFEIQINRIQLDQRVLFFEIKSCVS